MKNKEASKFYDGSRLLSYGCTFNMVVGNRTAGKSFYWKQYAVKKFLKDGSQFIYVRRYKNDLKRTAKNFFKDIAFKFPDVKFVVKGKEYYINDKLAGYALALTEEENFKSNTLPEVKTIIFDEFLNKSEKYLGGRTGEADVFAVFDLYQTVARGDGKFIRDDVKFILISNAMTVINPYFLQWGIDKRLQKGTKFLKQIDGRGWALELYINESANEAVQESGFGDAIRGTDYEKMAVNNEFFLDSNEFIKKFPAGCSYQCTFSYGNTDFGLWYDRKTGCYYVNRKADPNCLIVYALDIDSHTQKTRLVSHSSVFYKGLKKAIENGTMFFDSQQAKNAVLQFLKL